jgi:putative ATPase
MDTTTPLAYRMRPQGLEDFIGQAHILGEDKPLRVAIERQTLHSMILWGPPGTGKTTLAHIIAEQLDAAWFSLSAVMSGVRDIRQAMQDAESLKSQGQASVLFVDEVHRFNKAQQDAFLPYIENGTVMFIGATTENPSFELVNALLSRARVYVLKSLTVADIVHILERATTTLTCQFNTTHLHAIAKAADGDARRALNSLEIIADLASDGVVEDQMLQLALSGGTRRFDKGGDAFYDQISALHKSVRGSNPDGALYWLCRMLDGGCDPRYIARRLVRMASEDIGNADPRALDIALAASQSYERLGTPEGELALAQCVVYLAVAAKSNAVYTAFKHAMKDARTSGSLDVPLHLSNAPTRLMKELDYGKDYRYAHDEAEAYAAGEQYLPDELQGRQYYHPVERGLEIKIREKMAKLAALDERKNHQ